MLLSDKWSRVGDWPRDIVIPDRDVTLEVCNSEHRHVKYELWEGRMTRRDSNIPVRVKVMVKVLKKDDVERNLKVQYCSHHSASLLSYLTSAMQTLREAVLVLKELKHDNLVPFYGMTPKIENQNANRLHV